MLYRNDIDSENFGANLTGKEGDYHGKKEGRKKTSQDSKEEGNKKEEVIISSRSFVQEEIPSVITGGIFISRLFTIIPFVVSLSRLLL